MNKIINENVIKEFIDNKDKYILVITNKGRMKKCTLSTFETMKRKSQTLQISRLGKNEQIAYIKSVKNSKFVKAAGSKIADTKKALGNVVSSAKKSVSNKWNSITRWAFA